MIGLAVAPLRVFPHPDGDVNAEDRAQWLYLYRGVPLSGLPIEGRSRMLIAATMRRGI